jgi:hypothetical protein
VKYGNWAGEDGRKCFDKELILGAEKNYEIYLKEQKQND